MEDCCKDNDKERGEDIIAKGGKLKVNKGIILWILIAILAVAVIYVVFFKDAASAQAIASTSQAARSSSGMVGGC